MLIAPAILAIEIAFSSSAKNASLTHDDLPLRFNDNSQAFSSINQGEEAFFFVDWICLFYLLPCAVSTRISFGCCKTFLLNVP